MNYAFKLKVQPEAASLWIGSRFLEDWFPPDGALFDPGTRHFEAGATALDVTEFLATRLVWLRAS